MRVLSILSALAGLLAGQLQGGPASTCMNIPNSQKQQCGFNIMGRNSRSSCLQQGCCYDSSPGDWSFTPWCYQPLQFDPSTTTTATTFDPFPTSTTFFPTSTSFTSTATVTTRVPNPTTTFSFSSFTPVPTFISQPDNSGSGSNDGGMSLGLKVVIILASIIGLIAVIGLASYLYNKRKREREFTKIDMSLHRPDPPTIARPNRPGRVAFGAAGVAAAGAAVASSATEAQGMSSIPPPPKLFHQEQQRRYAAGPSNHTDLSETDVSSAVPVPANGQPYFTHFARREEKQVSPVVSTPISDQFMQHSPPLQQPQQLEYVQYPPQPHEVYNNPAPQRRQDHDTAFQQQLMESQRILESDVGTNSGIAGQQFLTPVYVNGVFVGYSNQITQQFNQ